MVASCKGPSRRVMRCRNGSMTRWPGMRVTKHRFSELLVREPVLDLHQGKRGKASTIQTTTKPIALTMHGYKPTTASCFDATPATGELQSHNGSCVGCQTLYQEEGAVKSPRRKHLSQQGYNNWARHEGNLTP